MSSFPNTKIAMALGAILCASMLSAQQYTISTVVGGGPPPSSISATSVRLPISGGIAMGSPGNIYFSAGNSVMKVDVNGILTRVAGTGQYGYSGDGGPALSAQLAWPAGLAFDSSGNLFIADNANHRIRKVNPAGIISTVVGGNAGYSGDGGFAVNATLNWPTAVAMDTSGEMFIADTANQVVRKVDARGIITTIATGLNSPEGVAVNSSGDLYIADYATEDGCCEIVYSGRIVKMTADGNSAILTSGVPGLQSPRGMAIDATGDIFVADAIGDRVWKVSPGGVFSVASGNSFDEYACPSDYPVSRDQLICPMGVAVDGSGNFLGAR